MALGRIQAADAVGGKITIADFDLAYQDKPIDQRFFEKNKLVIAGRLIR
jgi:hypothetical protein